MNTKQLSMDGTVYNLEYIIGDVLRVDKMGKTEVSGNYQSINSTTIVHDKVYISTNNGEKVVELENWDIACRETNQVAFASVSVKNDTPVYVGFKNFTTNFTTFNEDSIYDVCSGPGHVVGIYILGFLTFVAAIFKFISVYNPYSIKFPIEYVSIGFKIMIVIFLFFFVKRIIAKSRYKKRNAILKTEITDYFNSIVLK